MKKNKSGWPDLVELLRDYSEGPTEIWGRVCDEAADEIERLRREMKNAYEWIDRRGCGDDCKTWEPDTLDPAMLINSGNCTCGRVEIMDSALRGDHQPGQTHP